MAAQLKQDLGIDAALVVGNSGELSVWVDGEKVIEKRWARFPDPSDVVAAVRARAT